MSFGLSSWRFLHDEDDEDNGNESEDRSPAQGPVPIPVECDRKATADNVTETAGLKKVNESLIIQ
jgi:hypothetical protein